MSTHVSSLIVRLIDQVTGPARGIEDSLRRINRAGSGSGATPSFADRMATQQARVGDALKRNDAALDNSRGRMVDAVGGIYLLKQGFDGTVGSAARFESAMADVAKVSGFDDAGLKAYGKRLSELAVTEIPMAVEELAALSAAAAQSGVADAELFDFTKMTAKAAVAWEMAGDAAGDSLAKIKTQLGLSTAETELFSDAINHLSDNSASSAADLVDYIRRVGAQGEFFGFAKEETLAFGSAMVATGAQSEVAATSFRNMGRALTRGESATKRQSAAYAKLGMDAETVAKQMQEDAVGTTMKVIEALGQLPEHTQASTLSDLFGDEARALQPLIGDIDILRQSLGQVAEETDYAGSVTNEFGRRAETTEYALQKLKNQVSSIGRVIGDALIPAIKDATAVAGPFINRTAELAGEFPGLTRFVFAAATGFVALRVATAALTFVGLLGKGGALSLLAGGLRALTFLGTPVAGFFETLRMRNALAARSLGRTPRVLERIGDAARVLVRRVPGVGLAGKALAVVGGALAGITAPVWLGVAAGALALGAAGTYLYKKWETVSSFMSGMGQRLSEELAPALDWVGEKWGAFADLIHLDAISERIGAGLSRAREIVGNFFTWLGSFFKKEVISEEDKEAFSASGYDAADKLISGIKKGFTELLPWLAGQWAIDLLESVSGIDLSEAGRKAVDTLKQAFRDFIDWIKGLPAMIIEAIGDIDLTSAIKWPRMPWSSAEGGEPVANRGDPRSRRSGHRASGGPVWSGGSFLVGENEPEIFSPSTGGQITPLSEIERRVDNLMRESSREVSSRSSPKGPGPISVTVGDIIINGASNASDMARQISLKISQEIEASLRGLHADTEARY